METLNNKGEIGRNWKKIYPPELILNKENKEDNEASFLDLAINVEDKKFVTKIYDKRDAFPFEIVSLPDLRGNIAETPAYGVLKGQMIRYARNSSKFMDFAERIAKMVRKILPKDFEINRIKKTLKQCMDHHPWIATKYDMLREELLKKLKPLLYK